MTSGSLPPVNDYRDMRDQSNTFMQRGGTTGPVGLGNQNTITGTVTLGPQKIARVRENIRAPLALVQDVPKIEHQLVAEAIEDALEEADKVDPKPRVIRRCVDEGLKALASYIGPVAGKSLFTRLQGVATISMAL